MPGPEDSFTGSFCPVARHLICVPPTSTTRIFFGCCCTAASFRESAWNRQGFPGTSDSLSPTRLLFFQLGPARIESVQGLLRLIHFDTGGLQTGRIAGHV